MKFNSINEIVKAVQTLRKEKTGKNMHYPILFKKALNDFAKTSKDS